MGVMVGGYTAHVPSVPATVTSVSRLPQVVTAFKKQATQVSPNPVIVTAGHGRTGDS